ncbi:MAG TPA: hypothetical protein VKJ47_08665 [Candidatus Binatia bacterium]|nr:hypothetical protein [Candidatus Binatia bacterium]
MKVFALFSPRPALPPEMRSAQQRALLFGVVGLVLCAVGAVFSPEQFFRAYLLAYVFWIGVALGCLAIIMVYHLSGGAWGVVIRRMLESATRTLPLMIVLFVPLVFGLHDLYAWARPEVVAADELLQHKRPYLNVPFFLLRAALYFVAWGGVAYFINKWSLEQDQRAADPRPTRRLRLLSGPGLILYGLAITFAAVDWLMSLEPHWYSTIFGATLMVGQGLNAFAFAIMVAALLADRAPLSRVISPVHFQDLGSLLLAFVMLWTYMAFAQWLLVWSGNLPEENFWYVHRLQGGWQWFGVVLIVFHFALPFVLLLSRDLKRNARALAVVAGAIMVMRFVDLFWLIVPAFYPEGVHIHWMYVVAPLSLGAVWLAVFIRQLGERPLLPLHDPNLRGAIAHGRH